MLGWLRGAQEGVPPTIKTCSRRAAASAICKINIDTDLRLAVTAANSGPFCLRSALLKPSIRAYLTAGRGVRGMVAA